MAARSTTFQCVLLLALSASAMHVVVAAEEIQVVSVPLDKAQIQKFLYNERQQIGSESEDVKSTDTKINEDETNTEELEELAEYLLSDMTKQLSLMENNAQSSSPSEEEEEGEGEKKDVPTISKRNSSSEENEDVWIVEMSPDAKITQYFLNNERKYMDDIQEELEPERSTTDTNAVSVDEVGVDVVALIERQTHPRIDLMQTFIHEERPGSEFDNSPIESVHFNSDNKLSTQNVDLCGTVNLNKIVDEVINDIRKDIIDRGLDKIKIPDIHESFKKSVGIMSVTGDFKATHGWAKNLSTIHRTADVIASSEGNSLTIACGFGLSDLEFGYDSYKAEFMHIGPSGTLDAVISQNSLLLNATISWNNHTCKTKINYLSLNQFGGFKLKITGVGPLNFLVTKISEWVFQRFKEQIKQKVETTLTEIMEKQLATFECMNYLLKVVMLT